MDFIGTAKLASRKFLPIYIPTRNICEIIEGNLDFERWLSFIVRRIGFQIGQIRSQILVLLISLLTWSF